ncbi:flagella biosynthesis regulator Flk [Rouxiella badensis]|jgi:cytochrome c-type biogenesis protein CcmH/NrfF|uniref:flagella biosynthesis regulator Flk n=1 Tax=Rouxiella badensis TaxID=1646377 RepID=UPI00036520E8|nr:flagella biosynthesis regulator Flk [Rouxiella badensis]MCC3721173.1 flagella biosynthesis regulator Flk [Rouxiella badensis]MCC3730932.1 flagella biosynthesis regulator Flk [Rouxiella badensis]MCC3734605.1 flagella biosynthesis regulator Flk [Rouxiella badensis]MCC3742410.1 flagella biosynthesis regulator Flk [Rouxiella badensis]MCC3760078.1 flagella biosynthesis regulator Flk [Rouxiella badensis]
MQPLSGRSPVDENREQPDGQTVPAGAGENHPLTPAQRTTLEKLIVKLMALTTMKSPEIWANLRHDLSLPHDAELNASQCAQAETLLLAKLNQAQDSHATRQLMQQLTELVPLGNNRQAVSEFIRQNFGHTVLSQLSHEQLEKVLVLIQSREMAIPQPQLTAVMDRPLLPAEHNNLQQSVTKLSAATGEAPAKIWQDLFMLVGVKVGDPIPAKHFQLLTQFAQVKITVSQQTAPTLTSLLSVLKQPATELEQHRLSDYAASNFHATPKTPLLPAQVNSLITVLFSQRVGNTVRHDRPQERQPRISNSTSRVNPFVAMLPESMRPNGGVWLTVIILVLLALVLWLVV